MNKIKTILRYAKKIDIKNMLKIIKEVSSKSNKNIVYIFLDVIYCGLVYGAGYYDYQEFEFYLLNRKERKTYLTRAKNNLIIKSYNNKDDFYKLDDKGLFNKNFKQYIKRDYLVINDTSFTKFKNFTKKHQELIVKPIDGDGGRGVEKVIIKKNTDLKRLFNKLLKNKQILIEECVKQHKEINKLYSKSVNTLRLFTFYDGKEVYILNSVFKIGNGGVTDSFSSGSMYTFVTDEGVIAVPAIDQNDKIFKIHPITKKEIIGFKVPLYKEACDLVKKGAKLTPTIKYIGWDVALTPNGPAIIEGNSFPGVYQIKPSFLKDKIGLIPKYQKVMKIK
ncbi:MAG: sugar-transfer associated ATP-grasp domain-containing protein [Bacilli bacterium]|nr:sugar-transfer associated ATP-grasp domain-containing protein [Bacilli bacterium]